MIITDNLLLSEGFLLFVFIVTLIIIGFVRWRLLAYIGFLLLLFSLYFFRNPHRTCPAQQNAIVAPADGVIVAITTDVNKTEGYGTKVSIFLSLWDAHVQWAPIAGTIEEVRYTPGTFSFAFLPKSSLYNEHNDIIIRHASNQKILVRQIAGTFARRISCWVSEGMSVALCEKIGMIRFGSRVDVCLPPGALCAVQGGEYVQGGETIIGYLSL